VVGESRGWNCHPNTVWRVLLLPLFNHHSFQRGSARYVYIAIRGICHQSPSSLEFWAGENQLDFVVTEHWEAPTAFNTKPLCSIRSGRGSIVLYNQGSAFHRMLTGEKGMVDAISKYGGADRLANAMAVVAHKCLSACDA